MGCRLLPNYGRHQCLCCTRSASVSVKQLMLTCLADCPGKASGITAKLVLVLLSFMTAFTAAFCSLHAVSVFHLLVPYACCCNALCRCPCTLGQASVCTAATPYPLPQTHIYSICLILIAFHHSLGHHHQISCLLWMHDRSQHCCRNCGSASGQQQSSQPTALTACGWHDHINVIM